MAKRPRFEQLNEYPEPEDNNKRWISILIVVGIAVVVLYVGTHYWYGCDDWGIVKFCSIVKKPL